MSVRSSAPGYALAFFPTLALGILFLVPFGIMASISVAHRITGGFYEPGFTLASYWRFVSPFFGNILLSSVVLSALAAILAVMIAFPFTYLLTRQPRRIQVPILVGLLAVLSLSEVIVGFSWSTLLSRSAGISNLFVAIGLMEKAQSWTPGFYAVVAGLTYVSLPYATMVLYPALSRLDPELPEAARTLGASPLRAFFEVIVPVSRRAIVACLIMAFVYSLGSYLLPSLLGRPQHWTITVHITDQAIYQSNLPFASAMAVFLLITALALVGFTQKFLGEKA